MKKTRPNKHKLSDIDEATGTAICATCGPVKVYARGQWWLCSVLSAKRTREHHLKAKYGISPEQFQKMVDQQGGECAAKCGRPGTHVDHDHQTGRVRGLLCHNCNVAIGLADDCVERLRSLADYISSNGIY